MTRDQFDDLVRQAETDPDAASVVLDLLYEAGAIDTVELLEDLRQQRPDVLAVALAASRCQLMRMREIPETTLDRGAMGTHTPETTDC